MHDEQEPEGADAGVEATGEGEAGSESYEGSDLGGDDEAALDRERLLAEVRLEATRARAAWSLVQPQHFALLAANCLFFTSGLAAWNRGPVDAAPGSVPLVHGVDSIAGAAIFALSLYGFWIATFNLRHRPMVIWPFLVNALIALVVGISGFTRAIGSEAWDHALRYRESLVAPGYWLLVAGGMLVLFVLVGGIMKGASKAKAAQAEGGARRRRR
jgi:hypothetical protein